MEFSTIDVVALTARVEKLESANRRWKLVNAFLLLSGVSILLMGAKPADRIEPPGVLRARSVEAQDFVLKDADGHVYARLSLSPQARVKKNGGTYLLPDDALPGQPSLQFYNDKGDVVWTAPSAAHFLPAK